MSRSSLISQEVLQAASQNARGDSGCREVMKVFVGPIKI